MRLELLPDARRAENGVTSTGEHAQRAVGDGLEHLAVVGVDCPLDDRVVIGCEERRGVVAQRTHRFTPHRDVHEEQGSGLPVGRRPFVGERGGRSELRLEPFARDLEQALRPRDVLEPVLAEIEQLHVQELAVLDDPGGRVGEQDLASVRGRADPRRAVDADADVAVVMQLRLGGVDTYPHAKTCSFGPVRGSDRTLGVDRGRNGIAGLLERGEERVALRIDDVTTARLERRSQHTAVLGPHVAEARPEQTDEVGRALDVGEEKRHRALRQSRSLVHDARDRRTRPLAEQRPARCGC